jgi:ribosomal-protein-alanine N-acetyltransferase
VTVPREGRPVRKDPVQFETPRLILRPPSSGDVQAVFDLAGDPRAVVHNPSDRLQDDTEAEELLGRWVVHWEQFGFGYWLVREAGRAPTVGVCGVKVVSFRSAPALNLLCRFTPEVWGRGFATEAATAVVQSARLIKPERPLIARVRSSNVASQRVALKAGFLRMPSWDQSGEDGAELLFLAG